MNYLLFNNTKWDINLWKNSIMYTYTTLIYGHFKVWLLHYIVFYSFNTCKNKNLNNCLKLLHIIDYLLFNNTKWDINLWKILIMYTKQKLRYGYFKVWVLMYIVLYSFNACKNKKLQKKPKNCCTALNICCLITLDKTITFGKSQLCTHNQRWNMDILKSDCYYIMCFIALMHVKIKILKKLFLVCCTALIICCLITLNEILTWRKIQLCTHNHSWDMDILNSNKYCILCSTALIYVKIHIWNTALKLLYIIDYLWFNNTKWDIYL